MYPDTRRSTAGKKTISFPRESSDSFCTNPWLTMTAEVLRERKQEQIQCKMPLLSHCINLRTVPLLQEDISIGLR